MNWNRRLATATLTLAALALWAALHAPALTAQDPFGRPPTSELSLGDRLSGGLTVGVAIPRGGFSQLAGVGFELNGHVLLGAGWLGLRMTGTGTYGLAQEVVAELPGVGRLSVRNRIATFDIGPQVTVSVGRIRPYGYATVGGAYVRTESSIGRTTILGTRFSESPGYSDITHVLTAGGGLYVPLSTGARRGARRVALDLSAQYRWNGDTRFLGRNGITLTPAGGLALNPIDLGANLLVFSLGVAVGL